MSKISFIIPNRGGDKLPLVIKNINEIYKEFSPEIIIVTQNDNDLFKRGQLFNIGIKYATSNNLMLTDNDIIHFHKIDFDLIYKNYKKPFSCFKHFCDVIYKDNHFERIGYRLNNKGNGGCNFITKEDYIKINGMSNLYCGWGAEDDEYKNRVVKIFNEWVKIPNLLGHIQHPKRINKNPKNTELNYIFLSQSNTFNYLEDGLLQTKYEEEKIIKTNNVTEIFVKNVSVSNDFKYKLEYNKHYE